MQREEADVAACGQLYSKSRLVLALLPPLSLFSFHAVLSPSQ